MVVLERKARRRGGGCAGAPGGEENEDQITPIKSGAGAALGRPLSNRGNSHPCERNTARRIRISSCTVEAEQSIQSAISEIVRCSTQYQRRMSRCRSDRMMPSPIAIHVYLRPLYSGQCQSIGFNQNPSQFQR